ncbi:MAG: M15 family metallopeptidase domain-containing protein [Acidimicrobiales bacterium]
MIRKGVSFDDSSRSRSRLRFGVGRTLIAVTFLCVAATVAPMPKLAQHADAATTAVTPCSTPDVRVLISTSRQSYERGARVVVTSSIRNISDKYCTVAVGPTSPSIIVTNVKGAAVWNSCYARDRRAACALYLAATTLKPGAAYAKSVVWDQRSGQTPTQVPPGTYHVTAQFSAIAGIHSTRFQLTTTVSPRSITVTQADSGKRITMNKGDRLFIQLSGPTIYTWTEPASSNGAVLARTAGSSGSAATATFVATSTGDVRVTSVDNPNCYPQCLPPSRLFSLTVSVNG